MSESIEPAKKRGRGRPVKYATKEERALATKKDKKEYYQKNQEEILRKNKEYYAANREISLKRTKEYQQQHKEEYRLYMHNYNRKRQDEIKKMKEQLESFRQILTK